MNSIQVHQVRNWMEKFIHCMSNKEKGIYINHYGRFRIYNKGQIIYEGYDIWQAVKMYNETQKD